MYTHKQTHIQTNLKSIYVWSQIGYHTQWTHPTPLKKHIYIGGHSWEMFVGGNREREREIKKHPENIWRGVCTYWNIKRQMLRDICK